MNSANYAYTKDGFVRIVGDDYTGRDYGHIAKRGVAIKLSPGAKAPRRAYPSDAGADLFAVEGFTLNPNEQLLVNTGVAIKIPVGYAAFIEPRSSQRARRVTCWGSGIIDSGYRGNIKIVLCNMGSEPYVVQAGDAIGQLLIKQVELVDFVDIWNDTDRGAGGFGSTGK